MKLSQISPTERPQERLEALGEQALSDAELMAMLLRSGNKELDVLAIARNLSIKRDHFLRSYHGALKISSVLKE